MHKVIFAALGAAAIAFAAPAIGQEIPLTPGAYWNVTAITIDDGHSADYADYLNGQFRQQQEYSKSKGWIKAYYILDNVNKRADEPDMYLVQIMDHRPDQAETVAREKEMNAYLKSDPRKMLAGSGERAKYRKIGSNEVLQEMNWAH